MRSLRTVTAAVLCSIIVAAATAGGVSAADRTRLAIVNGMPGKKVDVCVNGREVRSGLPYGRTVFKTTRTAKATVKFFARDPRRCRGTLLGKRTTSRDSATLVITRRAPRVVHFDNAGLAEYLTATSSMAAYRHAADVGVAFFHAALYRTDANLSPSAFGAFDKGDQDIAYWEPVTGLETLYLVTAVLTPTRGGKHARLAGPRMDPYREDRDYEFIAVGTRKANARIVKIDRAHRDPTP